MCGSVRFFTVNMRRIAQLADVSLSTVSVVLNHRTDVPVADETRQRVLRVAGEFGYANASIAKAIREPLRHIGIAVGDVVEAHRTFTSLIFEGVYDHMLARGYRPLLLPVGRYRSEDEADLATVPQRAFELHRSRLVDGLIIDKPHFLSAEITRMYKARIPLVVVNGGVQRIRAGVYVPSVTIDDYAGGRLATQHLLELGHRRVALMTRPYEKGPRAYHSTPVAEHRRGYVEALADAGVAADRNWIVEGDMLSKTTTADAIASLMQLPKRPSAIVVGDDIMAMIVTNTLRAMRLRVPHDVSIVGYGDQPIAQQLSDPELTTVRVPLVENGRSAAAKLVSILEKKPVPEGVTILHPTLVVRGTTMRNTHD